MDKSLMKPEQAGTRFDLWFSELDKLPKRLTDLENKMSGHHKTIDNRMAQADDQLSRGLLGSNGFNQIMEECNQARAAVINAGLKEIDEIYSDLDTVYKWATVPNAAAIADFNYDYYRLVELTEDEYKTLIKQYKDNYSMRCLIRSLAMMHKVEIVDYDRAMFTAVRKQTKAFIDYARAGISDPVIRKEWASALTKFVPKLNRAKTIKDKE